MSRIMQASLLFGKLLNQDEQETRQFSFLILKIILEKTFADKIDK